MALNVLGIDPGPEDKPNALVMLSGGLVIDAKELSAEMTRKYLADYSGNMIICCEMVACMGMSVGAEVFATVHQTGRLHEIASQRDLAWEPLTRIQIKTTICGTPGAKDTNVRQALLDRFQPLGGGATPQVGTKSKPGPLYGVKGHIWPALAAAVAYWERANNRRIDDTPTP